MKATNPYAEMLRGEFSLFMKDLQALPEEAYTHRFGPKTRTVADIVHEVNLVNDHVGLTIRGEPLFDWPDGYIFAPEGLDTKVAVIKAFRQSSERILETAEGFSPEQLEETILSDGRGTTRAERCRFMALHTSYHSGQLNFIQTLLGDDAWHWA